MRVLADVALALPLAAIVTVVLAGVTRNPAAVSVGLAAVVAAQVGLHLLAARVATRLNSAVLPWSLWATSAACLWIIVAGMVSMATHIGNVDAGVDDSALLVPATIVGAVGVASCVAAFAIAGRIGVRLLRLRATSPHPLVG